MLDVGTPVMLLLPIVGGATETEGAVVERSAALGTPETHEPGFWAAAPAKHPHIRWFFSLASEGSAWRRVPLYEPPIPESPEVTEAMKVAERVLLKGPKS